LNIIETPESNFQDGNDIVSGFQEITQTKSGEIAIIFKNRRITWHELGKTINKVANGLIKLGIQKNDRVCILSKNSVEYVEVFFGALIVGACAVPLPSMASTDALKMMILDSNSKVIFTSKDMKALIDPFIDGIECIISNGKIAFDFEDVGWCDYTKWMANSSDQKPDVKIEKNDDFNIIYSSGTTGVPKGITHTHGVRKVFGEGLKDIFSVPGMVNIISTPLYSNTTMVTWLSSMRWGTTSIIMEKFDAREFLKLCETEKVNVAMLVPVQYDRILRVADFNSFDLSSMLVKFSTSAPLKATMKRQILDRIPGELVEFYGLTEGGVSTMLIASEHQDKLESVGQPQENTELKVIDEEGRELPMGQTGELVGRQPFMMKGYENRLDATNEMLWYDQDGRAFFRSGDIGRLDEDGFLYLLDRKKDVIISGGLNIYATDLENELLKHPAVHEAAVIGIPSEQWGETPLGLVVLEEDANETPERILEWVNSRLGKSHRLYRVEFRDDLPKSSIGKVLKKELRQKYWD